MLLEYCEYVLRLEKFRSMLVIWMLTVTFIKVTAGFQDGLAAQAHSSVTPVVCPSSCYCDDKGEYVSCVGDGLWTFPTDIPNNTIRLELRNYRVKELLSEDLLSLVEIEEFKLQQSHLETVGNATFIANSKLERLDLSQNALSLLSSLVFNNLVNLRYLDVSSNSLQFIEQAFVGLVNLEQLNLRDNVLQDLTTNTFLGLHKVQYLNLDANNISSIEVGTFQYLTNLAHLIISNNPLTTLSRLDFFGSRLQFIDISHVGLDRIPQSLTKFVRDLRLAKNNLTHISAGDFDSYPYLGLLVLDDNCVSEIENDALGRQEYLMRLWLNGNCLKKVPPNLPPSLLALYMEENKLTELSSFSFKGLVHLEQLFLQRNEIKHMTSCVFCDLVSLKSLDLQANQIENLTAGVFNNLTQLQTLDLSQNNLKYIDSRCFESLSHLTTLQMSRVHTEVHMNEATFDPLHSLQTFEVYDSSILVHTILNSTRMLHSLRKLQELNLMHNRIVKLREDFPSFFPSLKLVKLSGNMWHCDDNIKWLSNWIKQSNIQFYSSYNIRCSTPENILFKPLMMLTESDFYTTTAIVVTEIVMTSKSPVLLTSEQPMSSSISVSAIHYTSETTVSMLGKEIQSDNEQPNYSSYERELKPTHPYQYNILNDNFDAENNSAVTSSPTETKTENTILKSSNFLTAETYTNVKYMTSETPRIAEAPASDPPFHSLKSVQRNPHNDSDYILKVSNPQTVSPQRRVLSSRLRVASQTNDTKNWDTKRVVFITTVLFCGCFVIVVGALTVFTCVRLRHRYQPVKHRNMRRSSSISYYPQKDEVSIVTLTEGTVGLKTTSHHGLGNKLYYIMENSTSTTDANAEALPDSQLQELLPQSHDSGRVY